MTIFDPDVGEYLIYSNELESASLEDLLLAEHKNAGNNVHRVVIKKYMTLGKS